MATADDIAAALVDGMEPLVARVKALERRLAEVESKAMRYGGTFNRAISYQRNTLVTHDGGLWLAIRETMGQRPGAGEDWALVSKGRG